MAGYVATKLGIFLMPGGTRLYTGDSRRESMKDSSEGSSGTLWLIVTPRPIDYGALFEGPKPIGFNLGAHGIEVD